jgi:hypothetical protein
MLKNSIEEFLDQDYLKMYELNTSDEDNIKKLKVLLKYINKEDKYPTSIHETINNDIINNINDTDIKNKLIKLKIKLYILDILILKKKIDFKSFDLNKLLNIIHNMFESNEQLNGILNTKVSKEYIKSQSGGYNKNNYYKYLKYKIKYYLLKI